MVKELLIHGNSKMGKGVFIYNLPPVKTCTPTSWCLEGKDNKPRCYALRNNFLLPSVIESANSRYLLSQQDDFVERMVGEIRKKKVDFFRFHSSGDFYSEEYVKKVIEIAKNCPDTLFRTTTRRRDLTDILKELNCTPNFIVRESLDAERPTPEMGLPFSVLSNLELAKGKDVYQCKEHCTPCGHYCWTHRTNMKFNEF